MARIVSDYVTGKRSLPQPYDAFVSKIPLAIVMPAALAVNDVIALMKLPPFTRLVDYDIMAPQLDSNGTPTLAMSIGYENAGQTDLGTVLEAGLIFGRGANGSISRCASPLASQDVSATERIVALKVTTAAATAALAGKTVFVLLHLVS